MTRALPTAEQIQGKLDAKNRCVTSRLCVQHKSPARSCAAPSNACSEKRQLEERLNALAAENAHLKAHGTAAGEALMPPPRGIGGGVLNQYHTMQAAPPAGGDGSMMRMHSVHASATIHQTFGHTPGRSGGGMQPPGLALRTPPLPRPGSSNMAFGGGGGGGIGAAYGGVGGGVGGMGPPGFRAATPANTGRALVSPMPSPQRQRTQLYGGGGQGAYGRG